MSKNLIKPPSDSYNAQKDDVIIRCRSNAFTLEELQDVMIEITKNPNHTVRSLAEALGWKITITSSAVMVCEAMQLIYERPEGSSQTRGRTIKARLPFGELKKNPEGELSVT